MQIFLTHLNLVYIRAITVINYYCHIHVFPAQSNKNCWMYEGNASRYIGNWSGLNTWSINTGCIRQGVASQVEPAIKTTLIKSPPWVRGQLTLSPVTSVWEDNLTMTSWWMDHPTSSWANFSGCLARFWHTTGHAALPLGRSIIHLQRPTSCQSSGALVLTPKALLRTCPNSSNMALRVYRISPNKRRARRQKTKPYPCLISMTLAMWTLEYLNFQCWKYDSDRISTYWDIANQSQKSGAHLFKQACLFSKIQYQTSCVLPLCDHI